MAVTGTVLRSHGGIYEVETEGGIVDATLRGRLKREQRIGDKVVAGDSVEIEPGDADSWTIEEVHDRRSSLVRKAPGKAPKAKVIVANVDQVAVVFSAARPDPHLRMLDRFLVLCEYSELDAIIIVNKTDLVGEAAARELFGVYADIGYSVIYTSVKAGAGVTAMSEQICGRITALAGPSGVGKSSLLNSIQPGLALRVASVSDAVQKGRHTTVTAQLIPLDCGGYVADTPGLRELGLWGIDSDDMDHCFPEFRGYLGGCRYGNSCTHTHEPGCLVRSAVEDGGIAETRYDSYRRMFEGDDDLENW